MGEMHTEPSEPQFSVYERRTQLGVHIEALRVRLRSQREQYHEKLFQPRSDPNLNERMWVPILQRLERGLATLSDERFESQEAVFEATIDVIDAAMAAGELPDTVVLPVLDLSVPVPTEAEQDLPAEESKRDPPEVAIEQLRQYLLTKYAAAPPLDQARDRETNELAKWLANSLDNPTALEAFSTEIVRRLLLWERSRKP